MLELAAIGPQHATELLAVLVEHGVLRVEQGPARAASDQSRSSAFAACFGQHGLTPAAEAHVGARFYFLGVASRLLC